MRRNSRPRGWLQDAWSANQHVPAILAGTKPPVTSESGYITMGGADEATDYVRDCGPAWHQTPGAVAWLNKLVAHLAKEAARVRNCPLTRVSVQFWSCGDPNDVNAEIWRFLEQARARRGVGKGMRVQAFEPSGISLGRLGTPADIAEMVAFLATAKGTT
jgi:hypothetical protein